jgi:hypothetical protein
VLVGRIYFCFQWARVGVLEGEALLAVGLFDRAKERNPGTNPAEPRRRISNSVRVDMAIGNDSVPFPPARLPTTVELRMKPIEDECEPRTLYGGETTLEIPIGKRAHKVHSSARINRLRKKSQTASEVPPGLKSVCENSVLEGHGFSHTL